MRGVKRTDRFGRWSAPLAANHQCFEAPCLVLVSIMKHHGEKKKKKKTKKRYLKR